MADGAAQVDVLRRLFPAHAGLRVEDRRGHVRLVPYPVRAADRIEHEALAYQSVNLKLCAFEFPGIVLAQRVFRDVEYGANCLLLQPGAEHRLDVSAALSCRLVRRSARASFRLPILPYDFRVIFGGRTSGGFWCVQTGKAAVFAYQRNIRQKP
jgi:hypothetical protein